MIGRAVILKPSALQSLAAGKLRRSDDSHTANTKEKAYIKQHVQELLNCYRHVHRVRTNNHILQDQPSDEVQMLSVHWLKLLECVGGDDQVWRKG